MVTTVKTRDAVATETLAWLKEAFGTYRPREFGVRLWDGSEWEPESGQDARFTLVLKHPGALKRMFWPPNQVTLGEAFIYDDFDIEGDLESAASLADHLGVLTGDVKRLVKLAWRLVTMPSPERECEGRVCAELDGRPHSKERDRAAIAYHYDVSNDFFQVWLDPDMVYSCAYFERPDDDLGTAQQRKLDYICRKLRLQPGERLLDIGCGWGALAIHAARHYGAEVTGITLSEAQVRLAGERIAEAGLADRCRVELLDYRDVEESRPFDKLVSVGMFEHVGAGLLPSYFEKTFRLLRPGGIFLNHGISAEANTEKLSRGSSFSQKYVFPDGELLPISTTLAIAERSGFEVRDVENLREHYAMTLRHWVRRLEKDAEVARAVVDDATYRVWRLFMAFSAYGFSRNTIQVHQSLLSKPDAGRSELPLTRADWYE
ncbi:MAG: class I SAM-dependent methyltransferase [Coriobacteriia bacterium]|nr:class I SAM-dependent methyltransferase [Coriobacteriia bacterium]